MSLTWQAVQDALFAAIVSASGLADDRILWSFQDVDEPALDNPITGGNANPAYVKLSLPTIATRGQDWLQIDYDATRAPGQEIEQRPTGFREVPLEIQVFTSSTADGTAANFLAEQIRTGLLLPSIRDALAAVGVTPFDPGPVNFVPDVVSANFRGRATCTVRLYVPAIALSEFTTYIAEVAGTITTTGGKQPNPTATPFDEPIDT